MTVNSLGSKAYLFFLVMKIAQRGYDTLGDTLSSLVSACLITKLVIERYHKNFFALVETVPLNNNSIARDSVFG